MLKFLYLHATGRADEGIFTGSARSFRVFTTFSENVGFFHSKSQKWSNFGNLVSNMLFIVQRH